MVKAKLFSTLICLSAALQSAALDVDWTYSTPDAQWQKCTEYEVIPYDRHNPYDMMVTPYAEQTMLGFGGCFAEVGWDALNQLGARDRANVMNQLFGADGLNLAFCRTPIGANDFARDWYSYNENDGDFAMKKFSVARDKKGLIPYIKAALKVNPALKLWGSPWSPPTWMKTNHHYSNKAADINGLKPENEMHPGDDQFIDKPEYLKAYALYFSKYLAAYKKNGININMLMFQNEPYTINVWPNCSWTPHMMKKFVGSYLGPELAKAHQNVDIWHGTMNTGKVGEVLEVVTDPVAGKYIKGVGIQWEGRDIVRDIYHHNNKLGLMCTENECGNGSNDWSAAEHTFDHIHSYVGDGCGAYMYFNMVLDEAGMSSWGWKQNSLVVANSKSKTASFTPEFYVMKHFSHFVPVGSVKMKTMGNDEHMLAFKKADGSIVIVIANKSKHERKVNITLDYTNVLSVKLKAKSFNTLVIK